MAQAKKSNDDRVKLLTPPFRLSFPAIFQPETFKDPNTGKESEPRYSVAALFYTLAFTDADKKLWAAMMTEAENAGKAKFNKFLKDLPANYKRPVHEGAEKEHLGAGYQDPGVKFITLSSYRRPGLVDVNRTPIIDPDEVYPGCWMRATISAYGYDNIGKGVAFGLHNLQKLKDDQSFGVERTAAEEEEAFAEVDEAWLADGSDAAPEIGADDPLG